MKRTHYTLLLSLLIVVLVLVVYLAAQSVNAPSELPVNDSPDQVGQEDPVEEPVEEDPEEPVVAGELSYVNASADDIVVTSLEAGDTISSPLVIEGRARGYWFFEATAPIVLTDWDGVIIAESYIEAQDEWMTEDFVDFRGEITFDTPAFNDRGTLILQSQNASGLPENDRALEMTVIFE